MRIGSDRQLEVLPPLIVDRKCPLLVLMAHPPKEDWSRPKVSQVLGLVRLVSIVSVVRPPPPIADR